MEKIHSMVSGPGMQLCTCMWTVTLDTCVVGLLLAPEVLSQVISYIIRMSHSQHKGNFTKMEFVYNSKHKINMPLNCVGGADLNLYEF
jgi:hypothetical protein